MTFNETLRDWLTTFGKILVSPTPTTFQTEAQKGEGKFPSAVGWLVFFSVYYFIFFSMAVNQVLFTTLIALVLALPLSIVLFTSAMHFVHQRIFQRNQYLYENLMYINVAILLPLQMIYMPVWTILLSTSLAAINTILYYVILFYQILLLVIAVKTIINLKYWQAVVTVFISIIFASLTFLCAIPFLTVMMDSVRGILH